MPSSRASRLKSSDASCETRVFNSASALPACESSPAEREYITASESLQFWLSRIKGACADEYIRLAQEIMT